jgi:thiol-disulfide isomerase/thioredoxin
MNTILLVLAFVVVGFLVYKYWKVTAKAPKSVVPPNEARIYMFYTDWCGHSKKAIPQWEKLEKSLKTSSYYGKSHVEAVGVNCETDVEKCTLYGINAYPTVIVETQDGITDFNKQVTTSNLKTLLRQVLGEERDSL